MEVITTERYRELKRELCGLGYGDEYEWSQNVTAPANADDFALEVAFVICNSGMKATIAQQIYERVRDALTGGRPLSEVYRHDGKARAIQQVWDERVTWLALFSEANDKLAFCEQLPWIGPITKFHLAKNFGVDCAKPDRHLVRLANAAGCTVEELCARLAAESGDRVATVDLILWRACSIGLLVPNTTATRRSGPPTPELRDKEVARKLGG